jgi:hypothetical protein
MGMMDEDDEPEEEVGGPCVHVADRPLAVDDVERDANRRLGF